MYLPFQSKVEFKLMALLAPEVRQAQVQEVNQYVLESKGQGASGHEQDD
jgi:hypothetical protein